MAAPQVREVFISGTGVSRDGTLMFILSSLVLAGHAYARSLKSGLTENPRMIL
jgi:hypothetical protein